MRKWYFIWLCGLILCIGVKPIRTPLTAMWYSPQVQSALDRTAENSTAATTTLIALARETANQPRILIDGRAADAPTAATVTPTDFSLNTGCTLTAEQVNAVLATYDSPAQGTGAVWAAQCQKTRIDNAYPLAMFLMESRAATDPSYIYAGQHNPGNIMAGNAPKFYSTWDAGITAQFTLLADYRETYDKKTIREAIYRWAPPTENQTSAYADFVEATVKGWREVNQGQYVADGPQGQPNRLETVIVPERAYTTPSITPEGCKLTNMRSAYDSSPSLQNFSIPAGGRWSFNDSWKVDYDTLVVCGLLGGGVCSNAAFISNAARHIGLLADAVDHQMIYEPSLDRADQLSIWSGSQDLVLTNHTGHTANFRIVFDGNTYYVQSWLS